MANDPTVHVVQLGDRLSRIAFLHGYATPAAIWDAPENAKLRAHRPNPEILMPGDEVFLPPRAPADHPAAERRETKLSLAPIPSWVELQLVVDGEIAVREGRARVVIDTEPYSKAAPYDHPLEISGGVVRFEVDPRVTEVTLIVEAPALSLRLLLGHLQPLDAPGSVGLEQRLSNLGFHCATTVPPGGAALKAHEIEKKNAAARFAAAHHVTPTAARLAAKGQP